MRLERDQRRLCVFGPRRLGQALEDLLVAKVDAVEAADGDGDTADGAGGQAQVGLQLSTFSGTKVRRSGSV